MAQFAKPSDYRGGSFFKPKEHFTTLALLIEPKDIEKGVPNEYRGKTTLRDEVLADITVFRNQGEIDRGEPSEVMKSAKVVHGMLTSTLEKILGGAMVATVTEIETQNGSGYVFRDVDSETEAAVGAYYDKREAAIEEALNDVPDFED